MEHSKRKTDFPGLVRELGEDISSYLCRVGELLVWLIILGGVSPYICIQLLNAFDQRHAAGLLTVMVLHFMTKPCLDSAIKRASYASLAGSILVPMTLLGAVGMLGKLPVDSPAIVAGKAAGSVGFFLGFVAYFALFVSEILKAYWKRLDELAQQKDYWRAYPKRLTQVIKTIVNRLRYVATNS